MTGMVVSDPEVEAGCARHHQGVVGEAQVEVGILDGATTVTDPADDHLKGISYFLFHLTFLSHRGIFWIGFRGSIFPFSNGHILVMWRE